MDQAGSTRIHENPRESLFVNMVALIIFKDILHLRQNSKYYRTIFAAVDFPVSVLFSLGLELK